MRVGVLSLQGDVMENIKFTEKAFELLGREDYEILEVKEEGDLKSLNGLIIPGGESTTMGRLYTVNGMLKSVRDAAIEGMPMLGICAGMILLSSTVKDRVVGATGQSLLNLLDVQVERNAFGRQRESFEKSISLRMDAFLPYGMTDESLRYDSGTFPGVFIRAPSITKVGHNVKILAEMDGQAVAVIQNGIIGTTFHPELVDNHLFHILFIKSMLGRL